MKTLTKIIFLIVLFNIAFSKWGVFEKIETLKDIKEKAEDIKDNLDFDDLSFSSFKSWISRDKSEPKEEESISKFDKIKKMVPDASNHQDIEDFWNGVFEALRLKRPTEIVDCFGKVSGPIFFRKLKLMGQLLQHSKDGKDIRLHTDYAHLDLLMHALEHAHNCMVDTNDFERMTHKLGIPNDPEYLKRAKYIYFQAKFADIADDFQVIVEHIDKKEFEQAGKDFGHMFKNIIKEYTHRGEDILAYQAFGNGLAGSLGVDLPKESVKCYNSKNAKYLMDFFRGISNSITEGRWYKADESATDYWEKEGKDLLEKIPNKVWKCDMNSEDSIQISEKIGIDLSSKEFMEKMWDYISDHNIMYYGYLRSMKLAFDKHDYLHAGASYAHLLKAVAKS